MIIKLSAALLLLAACTTKNKSYCDEATPCSTAARMYCDIDGVHSDPKTCIVTPVDGACNRATPCQAPTTPHCSDDSDGVCQGCTGSDQCGDALCHVVSGSCVECLESSDCDDAASCDPETFACRGCKANTECSSEVCELATGVCVAPAEVVYVANDGTDKASCGESASPCLTIGFALAQASPARPNLLLRDGEYPESLVLSEDVRIHGYDEVLLSPDLTNTQFGVLVTAHVSLSRLSIKPRNVGTNEWILKAISAEPGQASLTLRDLSVTGMVGGNGQLVSEGAPVIADNLVIEGNTSNFTVILLDADLRMSDSSVSNNEAKGLGTVWNTTQRVIEIDRCRIMNNLDGVAVQNGTLKVTNSIISGNVGRGVWVQPGSTVFIERNQIVENGQGGIWVDGSSYSIINNLIRGNGGAETGSPTTGGVHVSGTANDDEELLFNTFVENAATQDATALQCVDSNLQSSGNIFIGRSAIADEELVSVACSPTFSVFDPNDQLTEGTGNIAADPQFEISAAGEYRLKSTSPCIDSAAPEAAIALDFEGDSRPQGPRADIGYDEYTTP